MNFILKLFTKKPKTAEQKLRKNHQVYMRSSDWGKSIYFHDWQRRRLVGWMQLRPQIGDEFQCKMQTGLIGRFVITNVDYMRDPTDMFFADVEDITLRHEPEFCNYKNLEAEDVPMGYRKK